MLSSEEIPADNEAEDKRVTTAGTSKPRTRKKRKGVNTKSVATEASS